MPILEHFVDRTPGSFVEEKKYALVWHHRLADPEFGGWLANELVSMLEAMLAETELRAFRGQRVSDQACQNFDRQDLAFVVHAFPGIGFVEEKIEQA